MLLIMSILFIINFFIILEFDDIIDLYGNQRYAFAIMTPEIISSPLIMNGKKPLLNTLTILNRESYDITENFHYHSKR